jgi:biopolymer transport protein ExbD
MGAKLGTGGGPMADMNVTPLIDVVLVLLVVFMVITPMLQSGLPVDLPEATQTTSVNDVGQHIVVSIHPELGWAVEQEPADEETLVELINAEYRLNPARSILIKADKSLEYQDVRKLMDILADNNQTSVLIAAAEE